MIAQIVLNKDILTRITADIVRGLPRIVAGAMVLCLLSLVAVGEAQKDKKVEEVVVEVKELLGEVISFTPRKEPQFIGIAVEKENTDYIFLIDEDVRTVHKQSLSEIVIGDTVKVKYYVIIETDEKGKQRTKRVAKVITFVRSSLSLKGLRSE